MTRILPIICVLSMSTGCAPEAPTPDPEACQGAFEPGRVTARRLSHSEYGNSVLDVLELETMPSVSFPPDPIAAGFDNNGDALTVNRSLLELYLDSAEAVVAQAMSERGSEILTCTPDAADPRRCAEAILEPLAHRAFRRPASTSEITSLVDLVQAGTEAGDDFQSSIQTALSALLVSPQFLYRIAELRGAPGDVAPLGDYELASRLSYFLWQSPPDAELYAAAAAGELQSEEGLGAQMTRMLRHERAGELVDGFVTQWLHLARLDDVQPDAMLFPEFDETLREAMRQETLRFATHVIEDDQSPLAFIAANYTYADPTIARLYDLDNAQSVDPSVATDLGEQDRAGILSHPSILAMTSAADETSVIRRGVWFLENILCDPPPPPPVNVATDLPERHDGESLRDRLARHRGDPQCSSCHTRIDPMGFGFEHLDPLGRLRTDDGFGPVDNLGATPDGTEFVGPRELAVLLEEQGHFQQCFTRKLLTFALGRVVGSRDHCQIQEIANEIQAEQGISEAIRQIVTSNAFRTQRNEVTP